MRCSLLTRLWLTCALLRSSVGYAVAVPADTLSTTRSAVVQAVVLAGNLRTQDRIILREMSLQKGDTVRRTALSEKLLWDQRKIANTNLFITVTVATQPVVSVDTSLVTLIDVVVTVKERWYVFPSLIFDIADRNFNEWWYDRHHDLSRTVYGARLDYRNFTGANDKLTAVVQLGFTRRLQLAYARPYIDRAQRIGLRADISESTNREVAYRTQYDKWLYGKGNGELRRRFMTGVAITRRNGFYQFHTLELRYNRNAVADTIIRLNPDYFLNGHTRQRYFQLAYGFSYDRRDNVAYPLQGTLFSAGATQYGLLPGDDLHVLEVAGGVTRFWPLGGKFYVSNSVRGRMTLRGQQPYSSLRGLGNGQELVRGYELYVVDGQRYGLFKNSIKYQLFNTVRQLNWLHVRQFNTLPISVYLTAFGDAGYVRSTVAEEYQSRLANRWLVGTGLSLDVVTYYNLVMRISGSINGQGQKGVFFNLTQGF